MLVPVKTGNETTDFTLRILMPVQLARMGAERADYTDNSIMGKNLCSSALQGSCPPRMLSGRVVGWLQFT
ncbi:MAG: hypothetical protein QME51_09710 [Planctomycetota bacterium]|nr:hypothetical protein [Planctomycetota bacterium]